MAKYKKTVTTQPVRPAAKPIAEEKPVELIKGKPWSIYDFKVQAIIVGLLAFLFYVNTWKNEYAHDDGIVMVKNEFVQEGVKGIPGILTKDAYYSYYRQLNTTNQLSGGRFRPLSIMTFAIEQQFFGAVSADQVDSVLKQNQSYGVRGPQEQKLVHDMHIRHLISVFWYMLSVIALLYFLRYVVFRREPIMAFLAAIIFTIHPIHTEVVANVKSRDEIMSLLFMCLTFIFTFKHYEKIKIATWLHVLVIAPIILWMLYMINISAGSGTMMGVAGLLAVWMGIVYALYNGKKESIINSIDSGLKWGIAIISAIALLYLYYAYKNLTPENKQYSSYIYILMLVMICAWLAFLLFMPKEKREQVTMLVLALFCYYLAFLSKEYAITLAVLLPLSLYLFSNFSIKNSLMSLLPFMVVFALYMLMRYYTMEAVGEGSSDEVLNNPYLFAASNEKLATEISTCLRYVKLLFWPHPLSADYSYNTIPYVDFTDAMVWVSLFIHGALVLAMIAFLKRCFNADKPSTFLGIKLDKIPVETARILCFGLFFYFLHFALVCNIVFDIGATMGERLIYHSSVGFAICIALLLVKGAERIKPVSVSKWALGGFMIIIIALSGFKTIQRNGDWVNDSTLFGADIKTVPNSVLVSANVAASYITISDYQKNDSLRKDYLERAITILDHTVSIHRKFVAAFLNRGIAWYKLGNADNAKVNMDTVRMYYPTYPVLPGMYKLISEFYSKNGWESYGKVGKFPEAIVEFKKGLAIDSTNPDLWYNLGGAYYQLHQFPEAAYAWQKSYKYNPNNPNTINGLKSVQQILTQMNAAQPKAPVKPH